MILWHKEQVRIYPQNIFLEKCEDAAAFQLSGVYYQCEDYPKSFPGNCRWSVLRTNCPAYCAVCSE